jgi:hypothetical protein
MTMPMNSGTTISPPGTRLIVCKIFMFHPFSLWLFVTLIDRIRFVGSVFGFVAARYGICSISKPGPTK